MIPKPTTTWDASDAGAWASFLGFVVVPMFRDDAEVQDSVRRSMHVLLDGSRASSALLTSESGFPEIPRDVRSWVWSCDLRHLIVVDPVHDLLTVHRWDRYSPVAQTRLPTGAVDAERVLNRIEGAPTPSGPDIITHALGAFRRVRDLGVVDRLQAIRLFNLLLLAAEHIENAQQQHPNQVATVTAILDRLPQSALSLLGTLPEQGDLDLRILLEYLTTADPQTGLVPHSSLLLRHASSQLYQEAHLFFDRGGQTSLFPGMFPVAGDPDEQRRDVRFTPAPLARTLLREALAAVAPTAGDTLSVLDPACGSGVFLLEALRELSIAEDAPRLSLGGIDVSPIAEEVAGFCIRHALADVGSAVDADVRVRREDALRAEWGQPDLVAMNPPFISYQDMTEDQREATEGVLGDASRRRPDYAMAFISKALDSVRPGGAVAAVLPSALLENHAGMRWRTALQEAAHIRLLARFTGYGYFKTSTVEPAFVILVKKGPGVPPAPTKILLANQGMEDRALRLLRLNDMETAVQGVDFYTLNSSFIDARTWLPRSREALRVRESIRATTKTRVNSLFELRQGARTGHNPTFILAAQEYEELVPRSARSYFRLVAGNDTIRSGRICPEQHVFFPYDADGLAIRSEDELREKLGRYYDERLRPNRRTLLTRARVREDAWWRLTEHRAWQRTLTTKLVSAYFGQEGSFAWDARARYVVVQGIAWFPKFGAPTTEDTPGVSANAVARLCSAYLALLNSTFFVDILRAHCPAIRGGQLNLSNRFVESIPLPDLTADDQVSDIVEGLSDLGRTIQAKGLESFGVNATNQLATLSRRAYRVT